MTTDTEEEDPGEDAPGEDAPEDSEEESDPTEDEGDDLPEEEEGDEEVDEIEFEETEDFEDSEGGGEEDSEETSEEAEPEDEVEWQKPLGSGEYTVRPGDCLSSIAQASGHTWKTIWDDAANKAVADKRKSPNLLLPGDRLHIPELREKEKDVATEKRHRFMRKAIPDKLRIRFLECDEALANEPYEVVLDVGGTLTGTLDGEGKLDVSLPGQARKARVRIGKDDPREYEFSLGAVDPIDSVTGVQQRLANLGYSPGAIDGELGDQTRSAIAEFQSGQKGLKPTGFVDKKTLDRLEEVHDRRAS